MLWSKEVKWPPPPLHSIHCHLPITNTSHDSPEFLASCLHIFVFKHLTLHEGTCTYRSYTFREAIFYKFGWVFQADLVDIVFSSSIYLIMVKYEPQFVRKLKMEIVEYKQPPPHPTLLSYGWLYFWRTTTHSLPADNTWDSKWSEWESLQNSKLGFFEGVNSIPESVFYLPPFLKQREKEIMFAHDFRILHKGKVLCIPSYWPLRWLALHSVRAQCNMCKYWNVFAKLPLWLFIFCHDFKPAKSAPSLFPAHTLKKRLPTLSFVTLPQGSV